jgi:hypothetical protein
VAGSLVCAVQAHVGDASRPLSALLAGLLVAAALGTREARSRAHRIGVALVGAVLVGVAAATLAGPRDGVPRVLDLGYAAALAGLLGASAHAGGPAAARLARLAPAFGAAAGALGAAQLAATGPREWAELALRSYGWAALTQVGLPVLAGLAWLRLGAGDRDGRTADRAGVLVGLCLAALTAGATLAALPAPAPPPRPGEPLLRAVQLGSRQLAVLVTPMRPGPNLVHVVDAGAGGRGGEVGEMAGMPDMPVAGSPAAPSPVTVAAGAAPVVLTGRPGASGVWGVLDLPAGAGALTVADGGHRAVLPAAPGGLAEPAVQRVLAGPDGPECAIAALGALAAGGSAPPCPSSRLTAADAASMRYAVDYLAQHGISTIHLAADGSPRSAAAARLVRHAAARCGLRITPQPTLDATLLVVSGWSGATQALDEFTARAGNAPSGGVVLAPWLLTGQVLERASSEALALPFDPGAPSARQYSNTLLAALPGEAPSYAGYLGWAGAADARPGPVGLYGAAQVKVPMGGPMDDMAPGQPGDWYPGGTVVPVAHGSEGVGT